MGKDSLIRLREQLGRAIESDSLEDYRALAQGLAGALKRTDGSVPGPACQTAEVNENEVASVLQAVEDVWLGGSLPPFPVLSDPGDQARLAGLLSDMIAVQRFALAISKGDLSPSLKARGVMAGTFKAVQGSLRHLTWQTRMIARGDYSQRVDFMGEFSESFNSMVHALSEAHDRIERYMEELLRVNADLQAENTERKQAEEALRISREWLRVTLDSIGDAVLTVDTLGRVTFLNPVAAALTGWKESEAAGRPVGEVFRISNEKTGGPAEDIVQRVLWEGRPALLANDTALTSRDGRKIPVEDGAAPIRNGEGNLIGVVLVFRDVTKKRLARDELELRVRERTAELAKVNRDLEDFNHIAAHDLQEPLRQLITFGDRLATKCSAVLSPKDLYYVDRIQVLARRARSLTRDILKYSTISARIGQFCLTDLNSLVRKAVASLKDEIEQKDATVDVEELRSLEVDPAGITDVFANLISNSLKFVRKEKPGIRIHGSSSDDRQYTIFVEDNGIGFEEVFAERIFIPFQRLHGRSKYEGNGIGLAICRKILEVHGGTITARSRPSEGSTFVIALPIHRERMKSI